VLQEDITDYNNKFITIISDKCYYDNVLQFMSELNKVHCS